MSGDAAGGTAGLREAMGVPPDFCFHLADRKLGFLVTPVCREQILDLAVSRRGRSGCGTTLS